MELLKIETPRLLLRQFAIGDAEDVFRWKQGIRSVFQRKQKIQTLLLLEKSSDFVVVVHLQGLEPWAH